MNHLEVNLTVSPLSAHPPPPIILNNFKILQNDPETGAIFSQPPLISFKRDKNVGNFLVRSAFKTIEKPGTFKCTRSRCKTCPFVQNAAFPYIRVPQTAEKIWSKDSFFKSTPSIPTASTNAFHSINLFLFFMLPSSHQ